jgi:glycosyltransferase involved in cell wall biosynthesis
MTFASSLSIIVPIHRTNGRSQNLFSWITDSSLNDAEIILIHDNSDGESILDIRISLEGQPNVTVLEGYFHSPGLARNMGLDHASRDWVFFWDFDDLPNLENSLEMLETVIAQNLQIAVGNYQVQSSQDREILGQALMPLNNFKRQVNSTMLNPGLWRWLISRKHIGEKRFIPSMRGEDQYFLAEIEAHNQQLITFDKVVYSYFFGEANQTSNATEYDLDLLDTAALFIYKSKELHATSRRFAVVASINLTLSFVRRRIRLSVGQKRSDILRLLIQAIQIEPLIFLHIYRLKRSQSFDFRKSKMSPKKN